eukprot:13926291-Alexandrium_andersonii.AAC.1
MASAAAHASIERVGSPQRLLTRGNDGASKERLRPTHQTMDMQAGASAQAREDREGDWWEWSPSLHGIHVGDGIKVNVSCVGMGACN